jgi:hypothetical protein
VNVHEVVSRCRDLGVILAPGPGEKLRVSPPGRLPEDLRAELRKHKGEVLLLLRQTQATPWPCRHCGQPAVIEDVCPSPDGSWTLTLWHCEPCQTWGVTPDTLRQPPVWVSRKEQ